MWSAVLDAYQTFDPARWVGVYRELPGWAGALAVALGVFLVLAGGGRAFRLVAAPAGAVMAFIWGPALAARAAVAAADELVAWISAAVVGAASFVVPEVAVFIAFGVPTGFAGAHLAGGDSWWVGFLLGLAVGGTIGALLTRPVAAITASAAGAWLFVLGALALLQRFAPWAAGAARTPWAVILAASVIAVAGALYQLFVRPPSGMGRRGGAQTEKIHRDAEQRQPL